MSKAGPTVWHRPGAWPGGPPFLLHGHSMRLIAYYLKLELSLSPRVRLCLMGLVRTLRHHQPNPARSGRGCTTVEAYLACVCPHGVTCAL